MKYVQYEGITVPEIRGAKGGKGGGGVQAPNSLYSTDILFVTNAFGEGPIYRINPNGPQDIQIQDSAIDDLINIDSDGLEDNEKFITSTVFGTINQDPLPYFGESITTPQVFTSATVLKNGNISGIPESSITLQETSDNDWDSIRFNFVVDSLFTSNDEGGVNGNSISLRITIYNSIGSTVITTFNTTISGKSDTPYKVSFIINIPVDDKSLEGYRFSIDKTSADSEDAKIQDNIKIIGWDEIKNTPQAYPRTAIIGYALKAVDEHTGGVPNFTSMLKGLLIKVPSNYNQPILADGQIDWRELEVGKEDFPYTTHGYRLQQSGTDTVLTSENPEIYKGNWDGTFVYSWSQNPVWVLYDILTNSTYGLGIPEQNIDKYKFYQVAQYCDDCDSTTGRFKGVLGVSDGSYRYKPRNQYTSVRENQIGLPKGNIIAERRFICDISLVDIEEGLDVLNKIAGTFRSILIYSGGKISLASDMPEEYPVMLFNDVNIKQGTVEIAGGKESDIVTAVDVSYIEPTNHFKREVVRIDSQDANRGEDFTKIDNVLELDLPGVTRRSQAIRAARYQIAASEYLRRSITFTTGSDAMHLSPGDLVGVATTSSGVSYGYGGRVTSDSNTITANVMLEHFTDPPISDITFTANTNPMALRVIKQDSDRIDLYLLSNTDFNTYTTGNTSFGADVVRVAAISRFDPINRSINNLTSFDANNVPMTGDLWSIGEINNPNNYYTDKSAKLFKVTNIDRDTKTEEVMVSGIEYISNVYEDSDSYINYEPTAYTDVTSAFSTPPTPDFKLTSRLRTKIDGSVVVDGVMTRQTELLNYGQSIEPEYHVSYPRVVKMISNSSGSDPMTIFANSASGLTSNASFTYITGKNGYSTPIGDIKLLCTSYVVENLVNVSFQVSGLNDCYDENFQNHVLDVLESESLQSLKSVNKITIPVTQKSAENSSINFVAYRSALSATSEEILGFDKVSNKITIANKVSGLATLVTKLPPAPFYITINQILESDNYSNNSFYVKGSEFTNIQEGDVDKSLNINYYDIPVCPSSSDFIRFYVDGVVKSSGQYILNKNTNIANEANIQYSTNYLDARYRIELDHYTVPAIELGDNVEVSYNNTFSVVGSSYDPTSASYNTALTANSIYRVTLDRAPTFDLSSYHFLNITANPEGSIGNLSSNTFTFDYNKTTYPGTMNLANSRIYSVQLSSSFDRLYTADDLTIPELPLGTTTVRVKNKNRLGRSSPTVTRSIDISAMPIQKVDDLDILESLYREQTGGISVRATIEFTSIVGQEVTDYEISYRISEVEDIGTNDAGVGLTQYNTIKVSSEAVGDDNKIRYTINNVNRGLLIDSTTLTAKVTAINKKIRGITATKSITIVGKTAAPTNVQNFTGGQQDDQITLFWTYPRINDQLQDIDVKEVVIRRVPGLVDASLENFSAGAPLVTVSAPTARKSIPIDTFGSFTYLVRVRDTSGNFSETVASIGLTTTRPKRSTVVAAYSEDNPSSDFTSITNSNTEELNFPSFANSNTNGLSYAFTSIVDNANAYSSGFSSVAGDTTSLLADREGVYITQIRDFGQTVTGSIALDITGTQALQSSYNDQHNKVLEGVTEVSTQGGVLVDTDFGGIGHVLGFENTYNTTGRYDSNNKTWMTGSTSGNVWGIWNDGQFTGDVANANTYALIAGPINATAIALGHTFYANGEPTSSNNLANITVSGNSYTLVNFTQYNDTGLLTYQGDLVGVTTQTFIRTSTVPNINYANGNVNVSAFSNFTESSQGYIPYEVGTKTFRHFQIKHNVTNIRPNELDYIINKFRYTVEKTQTVYGNTIAYSSSPTTLDYEESGFLYRPTISYTVLDQIDSETNTTIAVTTAASNTEVSFKLIHINGSGEYAANSSANVMVTVVGV